MSPQRSTPDYDRKRDFGRTPEPRSGQREPEQCEPEERDFGERDGRASVFVVHRHDARRLHYDLRLELAGVLVSWAVPRGFSYDPTDKRLAVRTEDHPLAYQYFEGVIPDGEYGAGTMELWDAGTFRCVDAGGRPVALAGSVAQGEVKVILDGGRLRGEWHLVKTKADDRSWLLFKSRDEYSAADDRRAVDVDLRAARRVDGLPRRPRCRALGDASVPFSDAGFWFEMEFVGARALVSSADGGGSPRWHGLERGLRRACEADEGLGRALAAVRGQSFVLDGVVVVADADGRPSQAAISQRIGAAAGEDVALLQFYAFDVLHFDGRELRGLPLRDRKATLARIVPPSSARVLYVDHVAGDGERLCRSVAAAGLPGVIAKRSDRAYRTTTDDWLRIRVDPSGTRGAGVATGAVGLPTRSASRITNPGRIYWPDDGLTKSDLCSYYASVAGRLLPHLRDRPVHLHRFPHGIDGESFYQHKPADGSPEWLRVVDIAASDGEVVPHMVCDDRRTLLYLANLGSIDLHPWMSCVGSLDQPDWVVLDLDPKSASFRDVVAVARFAGELLFGIGLQPVLKTSGKTGLHICLRLLPGYTYEQSRMFAETVARILAKRHPELATVERRVAKRGARVYIDFGQNRRGQTIVAPYVVRPVPGATVSTPLSWAELGDDLDPRAFTILTVPSRSQTDTFAEAMPVDLLQAIDALFRVV